MHLWASLMAQRSRLSLQCGRYRRCGLDPWIGKIPWRRTWKPTPVFLPRESHGERSLVSYSPWGCKELDMTEATKQQQLLPRIVTIHGKGCGVMTRVLVWCIFCPKLCESRQDTASIGYSSWSFLKYMYILFSCN